MDAYKARELVLKNKAKDRLKPVLEKIESAASSGKLSIRVGSNELDKYVKELLIEKGFKVEEEREETDYHRSICREWEVSWKW